MKEGEKGSRFEYDEPRLGVQGCRPVPALPLYEPVAQYDVDSGDEVTAVAAVVVAAVAAAAVDVVGGSGWDAMTVGLGGGRCGWCSEYGSGCACAGFLPGAAVNVGAGSSKVGSGGAPGRRALNGCWTSRPVPMPGGIARVARFAAAASRVAATGRTETGTPVSVVGGKARSPSQSRFPERAPERSGGSRARRSRARS